MRTLTLLVANCHIRPPARSILWAPTVNKPQRHLLALPRPVRLCDSPADTPDNGPTPSRRPVRRGLYLVFAHCPPLPSPAADPAHKTQRDGRELRQPEGSLPHHEPPCDSDRILPLFYCARFRRLAAQRKLLAGGSILEHSAVSVQWTFRSLGAHGGGAKPVP